MKENYALMTCPDVKPVVGGRDCSIDIPFNQMIPNMPMKSFFAACMQSLMVCIGNDRVI